jgi:LPS export ABC transporter protein LptC
MFKVKNLFWFIPLLILLTYPLWQQYVADFLRPADDINVSVEGAEAGRYLTMQGVAFSQCNKGRQEWRINASSLYSEKEEKDLRLESVRAVFFNDPASDGEPGKATNIRSSRARYEKAKQLLTLNDDVVVITASGYELRTETLYYREDLRRMSAFSGVAVTGKGLSLTGREMAYELDSQYLVVDGQVTAEIY